MTIRKVFINHKSEITGWLLKLEPIQNSTKYVFIEYIFFGSAIVYLTYFNTKAYHTWFAENHKHALSGYEKRN